MVDLKNEIDVDWFEELREETEKQDTQTASDWTQETGPRGATRWVNSEGDVRYREPQGVSGGDGGDGEEDDSGSDTTRDVPDSGVERRDDGYYVSAEPDREQDVQSFMEDETAQELIDTTNSGPMEGFSVHRNLDTYDAADDNAWIVSMTDVKVPADEGLTKEDVAEFYDEFFEVLEETTALRIGGYHFEDGERISIDLNVALTDAEEAEELGRELEQESIFNPYLALGQGDWENGSIMTDGSGDSPIESPEDVLDVLSDVDSLAKNLVNQLAALLDKTMKQDEERLDPQQEFEGEDSGRVLSRMNLFRYGWKEGADVEAVDENSAENGYVVNGERFVPV